MCWCNVVQLGIYGLMEVLVYSSVPSVVVGSVTRCSTWPDVTGENLARCYNVQAGVEINLLAYRPNRLGD